MKTVYPKEPAKNFNEWIKYIHEQANKKYKKEWEYQEKLPNTNAINVEVFIVENILPVCPSTFNQEV